MVAKIPTPTLTLYFSGFLLCNCALYMQTERDILTLFKFIYLTLKLACEMATLIINNSFL